MGEELVDRAMLVASELVTNAVVHTKGPLRLRLELVAGLLHLAVADQSPRLLGLAADLATPTPKAAGGCWWLTSWPAPGGAPSARGRQGDLVRAAALICS